MTVLSFLHLQPDLGYLATSGLARIRILSDMSGGGSSVGFIHVSYNVLSAVVDKPFVNKTAILRKYRHISTKILFCRHNNVLF